MHCLLLFLVPGIILNFSFLIIVSKMTLRHLGTDKDHGVAKSRTWLSDFTFTLHFHALEKEMAAHSSVLAWRILRTGEPGRLPSLGSHRVGHDWSDLAAAATTVALCDLIHYQSSAWQVTLESWAWISFPYYRCMLKFPLKCSYFQSEIHHLPQMAHFLCVLVRFCSLNQQTLKLPYFFQLSTPHTS